MPKEIAKNGKDYSQFSKDDLIKIVEKLETRKKYGLIWDEEKVKEQFEKDAENALPVLKEISGKEITDKDASKPINILIEGDNYHALSVLNFTHQGKIDVIYIDPPYNTGNKSWKYNNDFVEKDDEWKHSKWISFMSKRLRLAKNLLSEQGALICAIDHNEQEALGLLLKEIFPGMEITCVTIVHNPRGIQGDNFSYTHEYAYFVFPSGKYINRKQRSEDEAEWSNLRNWGGESTREYGYSLFYPIYFKGNKITKIGDIPAKSFHPQKAYQTLKNGELEVWPIDNNGIERKWRYSRETLSEILDQIRVIEIKRTTQVQILKSEDRYKTVWMDSKFDASIYGTQLIREILGREFPFPKSLYAVKECLNAVAVNKKDAIVLDFFAGSGTTGHAVLDMNKDDNGNRSFILCTNNELNGEEKGLRAKGLKEKDIQAHGICQFVTYPRIERVIKGYTNSKKEKVSGLGGSLKYFKTKFVKKNANGDDFKTRITHECTEMLCLREGVFDEVKKTDHCRIFQQGDKTLVVYYSLERKSLPALKKELEKMDGEKILYCFTLDQGGLNEKEFKNWKDITLEPIPQKILEVYNQIYDRS